jgi:hypothetical protein
METYRFRTIIGAYGSGESCAEQVLDAFAGIRADIGTVVGQNEGNDTLTIVFSLDAETLDEALEEGRRLLVGGLATSGLAPQPIASLNIERIVGASPEAAAPERDLQPA